MKKFLFLVTLAVLTFGQGYSQTATIMPLAAGDTVINAGTANKVILVTGGYSGVAIQAKAVEFGSVTSAGTIKVQGSLDGVLYTDIGSAYTVTDVVTQATMFYVSAPLPVYVRVLQTGSGTMNSVLSVRYVLRKYQN